MHHNLWILTVSGQDLSGRGLNDDLKPLKSWSSTQTHFGIIIPTFGYNYSDMRKFRSTIPNPVLQPTWMARGDDERE